LVDLDTWAWNTAREVPETPDAYAGSFILKRAAQNGDLSLYRTTVPLETTFTPSTLYGLKTNDVNTPAFTPIVFPLEIPNPRDTVAQGAYTLKVGYDSINQKYTYGWQENGLPPSNRPDYTNVYGLIWNE
jgi:hypothetical protein